MWLYIVNETPVFPLFLSLQHKLIYRKKLPALTIKLQKKKTNSEPLNNIDTRNQLQKANIRKTFFTHFHFLGYDLFVYCSLLTSRLVEIVLFLKTSAYNVF